MSTTRVYIRVVFLINHSEKICTPSAKLQKCNGVWICKSPPKSRYHCPSRPFTATYLALLMQVGRHNIYKCPLDIEQECVSSLKREVFVTIR